MTDVKPKRTIWAAVIPGYCLAAVLSLVLPGPTQGQQPGGGGRSGPPRAKAPDPSRPPEPGRPSEVERLRAELDQSARNLARLRALLTEGEAAQKAKAARLAELEGRGGGTRGGTALVIEDAQGREVRRFELKPGEVIRRLPTGAAGPAKPPGAGGGGGNTGGGGGTGRVMPPPGGNPRATRVPDSERRFQEIENKLNAILRELEALRRRPR